jgi:prepilin signal peptidase PulO-like enzyme (type II secretory pathway)
MLLTIVIFYALWIGGLSTTFYNRIPNNIPIGPTHKPKCNFCQKRISIVYFFPIIGYILSRGRCIHCKKRISPAYLILELTVFTFILLYFLIKKNSYNLASCIGDNFIITSLNGAYTIILLFIYIKYKHFGRNFLPTVLSYLTLSALKCAYGFIPSITDICIIIFISYHSAIIINAIHKGHPHLSDSNYAILLTSIATSTINLFLVSAFYIFVILLYYFRRYIIKFAIKDWIVFFFFTIKIIFLFYQ